MRLDLFDFILPEDRIALRPAEPREAARMLVVNPPSFEDGHVRDLPDLLRPGDVLVLNDTKVIPARLKGLRRRGDHSARIEVLLHRRETEGQWRAFARPAKRLSPQDRIVFEASGEPLTLEAIVLEKGEAGEILLSFDCAGSDLDRAILHLGETPLPPYIAAKRIADERDRSDYQTVYARRSGAVAAPTAGLHLTQDLFDTLKRLGIACHSLTLHVGAGTFLPVKTDDISKHRMHSEWGEIDASTAEALNEAKAKNGRIVAIGTTSLRLLESAADEDGTIRPFSGETAIFMTPGYRFKAADLLMTNFHLPKSTLFMLVSAFCGLDTMQAAYAHAIGSGYRFYSYGDASLLFREDRVA